MCGITGIFDRGGRPVDSRVIQKMGEALHYRGPDDEGLWVDGEIGLGHKRLSIIDLSARGRNPMFNEDGSVVIVFNGEIYNFKELRPSLQRKGHFFRSETDTEVIVHLYEEYGDQCIEKLNGMFAFAIWDRTRKTLILARDRFGIKPLYYAVIGDQFAFSSEIKSFLAIADFEAKMNPFALYEHLGFQNMFGSNSLFQDVSLLPAGHCLRVTAGQIREHEYWDLVFDPDENLDIHASAGRLRELFVQAVERQLMSDVPLGSFLSGGMDTGSISAVASRAVPSMHTFTCGFTIPEGASEFETYFDESQASKDLSNRLGTVHHELVLGADAMPASIDKVVWHLDEPRVGISYQVLYTSEMIKKYVKVVLSGVGGDELFGGYPWRYASILNPGGNFEDRYCRLWQRLLPDEEKKKLFTDEFLARIGDFSSRDSCEPYFKKARHFDTLHKAMYFDFKTFLNGLLIVDDKLNMANSVESRVPFLDNDLMDYVSRVPSRLKYDSVEGKIVLRKAMEGLLPEETLKRRKQGFTPPDETWYKGESLTYIKNIILGPRARDRGYFKPYYLEKILDDHVNNRVNHRFLIWSLMCLEWWNRLFVDGDPLRDGRSSR